MKLTPAQERFLTLCSDHPGQGAWIGYKPALKLIELGLLSVTARKYGSHSHYVTPAGKEWIAKFRGTEK